jgi:HK97 family phage major capsid protein
MADNPGPNSPTIRERIALGRSIQPIGYRANGCPIYPIFGADPTDSSNVGPTLTHSQSVNRLREITTELERLGELAEPTPEDETYFGELRDEFSRLDKHRKSLERQAQLAEVRQAAQGIGGYRVERGSGGNPSTGSGSGYDRDGILEPDSVEEHRFRNPWDIGEVRTFGRSPSEVNAELRSRALSAIEKMPVANDKVRAAATKIVEDFDDKHGNISKQALLTSSPAYMRAWSKMARNEQHLLTADETRAMDEVRAMSLTDAAGGYLVPFQLDPTVIITANGSYNQIRQVARQVVATADIWNGVSAGSVSWSWDAEAAEVSDDTPTLAQPAIPNYKAQGFVPISIEALADAENVSAEVGRLLAFGKDELEAAAFVLGTGSGQPTGIVTALTATASEINAAADDTFALADVFTIQGALPARYRSRASWLANNSIYNRVRQFDTAGGAALWERIGADRPALLLGRPALEAEGMDGSVTTTGAVSNFILVFGDFENYVITDRIGMTVEFIPHLFGTNRRPTGQRGWYAYFRTGADSVNDAAFRLLDVPSAA